MYARTLRNLILRVEHVGSTAVPDLLAKPILDIDLVVRDNGIFREIVATLEAMGYTHERDQTIPHREAFRTNSSARMEHHLYVCPASSNELQRHIRFRDTLRRDERLRREYEALKVQFASRANGSRALYAELKQREGGPFVERVLANYKPCT